MWAEPHNKNPLEKTTLSRQGITSQSKEMKDEGEVRLCPAINLMCLLAIVWGDISRLGVDYGPSRRACHQLACLQTSYNVNTLQLQMLELYTNDALQCLVVCGMDRACFKHQEHRTIGSCEQLLNGGCTNLEIRAMSGSACVCMDLMRHFAQVELCWRRTGQQGPGGSPGGH